MQFPLLIEGHQIYDVQKSWQLAKVYECVALLLWKGNTEKKQETGALTHHSLWPFK